MYHFKILEESWLVSISFYPRTPSQLGVSKKSFSPGKVCLYSLGPRSQQIWSWELCVTHTEDNFPSGASWAIGQSEVQRHWAIRLNLIRIKASGSPREPPPPPHPRGFG